MMPHSRLVGFAELSLATGKSVSALCTAASRQRLPLSRYRVGHIVTFDADEVAAWVAAGYPASPDWKISQAGRGNVALPRHSSAPTTKPNFSG